MVSVALVVRNASRTLEVALRSLQRQHFRAWELIVIDDGSTDNTAAILARFAEPRMRVERRSESRGLASRLNEIVSMARGDYVARMDGDDVAYPDRLGRQVAFMHTHGDVDLVGCSALVFNDEGGILGIRVVPERHEVVTAHPHGGFRIIHPTYFGRTAWFRQHRYDERMRFAQDQDLLYRSYRSSRFANVPDVLLGYRESRLSVSKLSRTRLYHVRALARDAAAHGDFVSLARGVGAHAVKALADAIVVSTNTHARLYRHRASAASGSQVTEWRRLWADLHTEPAS